MSDTKQVIVVRRDLKMRRGKEVAQGAHAAMAFITRQLQNGNAAVVLNLEEREWLESSFAKVCLRVDSEAELREIERKAAEVGVKCHVVVDSGRTEFGGVPTVTCLALGPDRSARIDQITGHLQLY
jgi:PTH2 family peptidyl-tRNA hydrolase